MFNLALIQGLYHGIQKDALRVLEELQEHGINADIFSGFRSFKEQERLYALGRTVPNTSIVTRAKPGMSMHNYGLAFDVVFKDKNNQWTWKEARAGDWLRVGMIAHKCGFTWGGNWGKFIDKPHIERNYGINIERLLELYKRCANIEGFVKKLDKHNEAINGSIGCRKEV